MRRSAGRPRPLSGLCGGFLSSELVDELYQSRACVYGMRRASLYVRYRGDGAAMGSGDEKVGGGGKKGSLRAALGRRSACEACQTNVSATRMGV